MDARKKAFAKLLSDMRGTLGDAIAAVKSGKATVVSGDMPRPADEGDGEHGEGCECAACKKASIKSMLGE